MQWSVATGCRIVLQKRRIDFRDHLLEFGQISDGIEGIRSLLQFLDLFGELKIALLPRLSQMIQALGGVFMQRQRFVLVTR